MATPPMTHGLALFAHGARDASWAAPFEAVASLVRARCPQRPVRLAVLEFMAPTLGEAGAQPVREGCTRIAVVPLFLGTGGHVRRDLPAMLLALQRAHPGVHFELHAAIGEHSAVQAAMADTVVALAGTPASDGADVATRPPAGTA